MIKQHRNILRLLKKINGPISTPAKLTAQFLNYTFEIFFRSFILLFFQFPIFLILNDPE